MAAALTTLERLAVGCHWTEGGRCFSFSGRDKTVYFQGADTATGRRPTSYGHFYPFLPLRGDPDAI